MENYDIFCRTLLTDKVKLKPRQIGNRLKEHMLTILQNKFEGMCSYHGFVKPGSIEIFKYSMGSIQALSLNGDVEYLVNYYADVCNPSMGSIVRTKVVNTNKFGILTHTGIKDKDKFIPILEIVVAKNMMNAQNDKNTDEIQIGDELHVEILGKKYELTDKKISAIGRVIDSDEDQNILDNTADLPQEKIDSDIEDDGDEETETDQEGEEEGDGEDADEVEADAEDDDSDNEEDDDDDESQFGGDLGSDGFFSDVDNDSGESGSASEDEE